MIKFVDLQTQYAPLRAEHEAAIVRVLDSCQFIQGEEVRLFEQEFADRLSIKHCVGVSSGTDALFLILQGLRIGPGDEVILPANTFIATALAVAHTGATPVFADINPYSFNIEPQWVLDNITEKTKAIIAVHLYGYPAEMDELLAIAKSFNVYLVEDACQGFGGSYKNQALGTIGVAGAYSHFPTKNLGCFGDGGSVVTSDDALEDKIRCLQEYGQRGKHNHESLGHNHRLDAIQAAILRVNLKYADAWIDRRIEIADIYSAMLEDCVIAPRYKDSLSRHAFHLYVIQTNSRDELRLFLDSYDVQTQVHYPTSCHLQPCFNYLPTASLPWAEWLSNRIVSLPMHPSMTDADVLYVCDKIIGFF